MRLWNKLRILKISLQLIRDPNRTDLVFKGVDIFANDGDQVPLRAVEETVMANEKFREMYAEKYAPAAPSLQKLALLPEGTFGHAVHAHMAANGLNFELFPRFEAHRPVQYLSARIYQDHDLWHALMGYGVEVEDELAIQAFGVAQFRSPVGVMLVAGGLIHLLGKSPQRAIEAFRKITEAYALGKRAPFLLSVRLHDLFTRPLDEVRRLSGIA